jgi:AAA15 family ATPase/GTPase
MEFKHQSAEGPVGLSLNQQSRGTQAWFSLAGPILGTLDLGSLLCIDELDASLHPYLAREVIRLFQDPKKNPNDAQLLFNTHDTTLLGNLLGEPGLHRDQIWFVEKDQEGASHLYPLTDFKPRKFENVERGYLQGRYGAIPFIEPAAIEEDAYTPPRL